MKRTLAIAFAVTAVVSASPARATDVQGVVSFEGMVVFAAPIPGISLDDLTVSIRTTTEPTGNGEQCEIAAVTSDSPDGTGAYPDAGTVSVDITISRGGPNVPDGQCIVTLEATGSDGVGTSARGTQTVFLDATEIGTSATVTVPNIVVRESKAVAGVDADCVRWVKKQLLYRARCNFLLLKSGPSIAVRCRDASAEEPPGCDPGNHVEAILALSHGDNDQQTDPPSAEAVDYDVLRDQVLCQKLFGKAAARYAAKRTKLVDKLCVDGGTDTDTCREARSREARPPLDAIDRCAADQMVDGGTGRFVPDVGAPCDECIDGLGDIDRRCLKGCFELAIAELSDGIVGDLPVCGNGIQQGGEFCDDGNASNADCCSDACGVLANTPGAEGPLPSPTCADGVDNDCDELTDAVDPDCQ